jgi:hypothetical protein
MINDDSDGDIGSEDCVVTEASGGNNCDENDKTIGEAEEQSYDHKLWYKSDLRGKRKNAKYYTKEEDLTILQYIEENEMFENVTGIKMWQDKDWRRRRW